MLAIVFPQHTHPAIEERYAAWQSELCLRRDTPNAVFVRADVDRPASEALSDVHAEIALVVTNPLILPGRDLARLLKAVLEHAGADAAVPVTNLSDVPEQHVP